MSNGGGKGRALLGLRRGMGMFWIGLALLACASFAPASAHGATFVVDGDDAVTDLDGCGGGPDAAADPCDTIQAAVSAAGEGDTVRVAASAKPYTEAVVIDKPGITLAGPQVDVAGELRGGQPEPGSEALVAPAEGAAAAITVAAGDARIDGLFFIGPVAQPVAAVTFAVGGGEVRNSVFVDHGPAILLAGSGHLVSRNLFRQAVSAHPSYGVASGSETADVAIRQNRFEGLRQAISMPGPGRNQRVAIEDNETVGADEGTDAAFALAGVADSSVRGNTLREGGRGLVVSGATGIRVDGNVITGAAGPGISIIPDAGLPASSGVTIARNQLIGNGAGIHVAAASLLDDVVVIANRLVGHAALGGAAIVHEAQEGGRRVLAADNWWGCNGGPGAPGCDAVQQLDPHSPVVAYPWLVLSSAAVPAVVTVPGAVRVSAGIQRDHAGREVPEIAPLGELPFEFSKLSGPGVLSDPGPAVGGAARATLESAVPGLSEVRARLDAAVADTHVGFVAPASAVPAPVVTARDVTPPALRRVRVEPRAFAVRSGRSPRGTTFRYELSEPAQVRFEIRRVSKMRHSKRMRSKLVDGFVVAGTAGHNERRFGGRARKRRLRPGRYRATLVATDSAGNVSRPGAAAFRVVRPAGRRGS
jgi:hypothetical protein